MVTLGKFASEVFSIIKNNPFLTAGEIFQIYQSKYPNTTRSRNEVAKRLSEMQAKGIIAKGGEAECALTGRNAATWETCRGAIVALSTQAAEETSRIVANTCDCSECSCDDEDEVEYDIPAFSTLSREEKSKIVAEMCGEPVAAIDDSDLAMLRQLRNAVEQLDSNPLVAMVVSSVPGMKGKAAQLKKALRYF